MKKHEEKLERRINEEAISRDQSFSTKDIVESIEKDFPGHSKNFLFDFVESTLSLNDDIFIFYDNNALISSFSFKSVFMKKAEFCSTPSENDLQKGIFIPGDFFKTFIKENKDISELKLLYLNKEQAIKIVETQVSVLEYEEKFPFTMRAQRKSREKLKAIAFWVKDFYVSTEFTRGDSILFRVEDYNEGILSFRKKSASERRNPPAIKKWCITAEQTFLKIFDELGTFSKFRDQMEELFTNSPELLQNPPVSFDEFLKASVTIAPMACNNANTKILWNKPDMSTDVDNKTEEELMSISTGRTASINDILEEIGLIILPDIIDSYMKDAMFKNISLEAVNARLMKFVPIPFADEAQRVTFEIMMEEKWEEISAIYNTDKDSVRGVFRNKLLDIYDYLLSTILEAEKKGILLTSISNQHFTKFSIFLSSLSSTLISLDDDYSDLDDKIVKKMEDIFSEFEIIKTISFH